MLETCILIIDEDIPPNTFTDLLAFVSLEKSQRIKKFRFYKDAQMSLLADLLIRIQLCQKLKIKNNNIEFFTNEHGKPFIDPMYQYFFNISHTGIHNNRNKYVASAIDNKEVGVDIEIINSENPWIAFDYLSIDEKEYIKNHPAEKQYNVFIEIWTRKESHIKYIGKGLDYPLHAFSTFQKNNLNYLTILKNQYVVGTVCTPRLTTYKQFVIHTKEIIKYAYSVLTPFT